jgi:hypothetical protein
VAPLDVFVNERLVALFATERPGVLVHDADMLREVAFVAKHFLADAALDVLDLFVEGFEVVLQAASAQERLLAQFTF